MMFKKLEKIERKGSLTEKGGNFVGVVLIFDLGLLLLAHWDKVLGHVAHVHHAGRVLEHVVPLEMINIRSNINVRLCFRLLTCVG